VSLLRIASLLLLPCLPVCDVSPLATIFFFALAIFDLAACLAPFCYHHSCCCWFPVCGWFCSIAGVHPVAGILMLLASLLLLVALIFFLGGLPANVAVGIAVLVSETLFQARDISSS
jgi:hypothetical protein